jgi:hypothetical protein
MMLPNSVPGFLAKFERERTGDDLAAGVVAASFRLLPRLDGAQLPVDPQLHRLDIGLALCERGELLIVSHARHWKPTSHCVSAERST